jgi:hypothetical protein
MGRAGDNTPDGRKASGVFGFRFFGGLFNGHVAKLFRIEDFATLQAFDELDVVVP